MEWISLDGKLDSLREIKTDDEIENIHIAESIGDKAFHIYWNISDLALQRRMLRLNWSII